MPSVAVADRAEFQVIAPKKGRSGTNAIRCLQHRAVQRQREFDNRRSFIQLRRSESFRNHAPEVVLHYGGNILRAISKPGDIQHQKYEPRIDQHEIEKISAHAHTGIGSAYFSACNRWRFRRLGLPQRRCRTLVLVSEEVHDAASTLKTVRASQKMCELS